MKNINEREDATKAEKYITGLKELSDDNTTPVEKVYITKENITGIIGNYNKNNNIEAEKKIDKKPLFARSDNTDSQSESKPYAGKDIILSIINIISIIFLFIILSKLKETSSELYKVKNEILQKSQNPKTGSVQLDNYLDKYDKLDGVFLNEAGVANFISEIESLKSPVSSFLKISFASQIALQDKTGNFGYPVVISFKGNWDQISMDLEKINNLPFLFRVVKFKSEYNEVEGVFELDYGIMLYVKENESKSK